MDSCGKHRCEVGADRHERGWRGRRAAPERLLDRTDVHVVTERSVGEFMRVAMVIRMIVVSL